MAGADPSEERVLVFAPTGRDAIATVAVLRKAGLSAAACGDLNALIHELAGGVGVVLVAEEALLGQAVDALVGWVARQPPWSDLPFLMLTSDREAPSIALSRELLIHQLQNVSLVERPVQPLTLVSAVRAALRARRHQYQVRDYLLERQQAEHRLEQLVGERTGALEASNKQLRAEMAERERMQEALRQSQKLEAIGQLTGGVAHDFNNLLTVLRSSVDLLRKHDLPEERRRRYIEAIGETVDRAAKLTGQLLAFARRQPLQAEVFDAAERTRRMVDILQTVVGSGIEIRTELLCEPCWVWSDPNQFETALINMAVNARDAMPGGGRLTIAVRTVRTIPAVRAHKAVEGGFVAVSVSDTGEGIAPDKIGRIFEPFFTTKEIGKGTGLGLSQVYGFAKQSGGDVDVQSEPGQGAMFTLYLPWARPEPRIAAEGPREAAPGQPVGGSILIVEDNPAVGEFAAQLLQDLGYATEWVGDATAALALFESDPERFDIVFSDVVMPGSMDGVGLARELKRRWPLVPVILTSGYSDVLAQGTEGSFELLRKPYSVEGLLQLIRKVGGEPRSG